MRGQLKTVIDFHTLQHCDYCRMQEHALVNRLTPQLRKELNAISFRISVPAGSTIFNEGDGAGEMQILRKGNVKVAMTSEEGRTIILYIAGPGELLGLSSVISGTPRKVTAIAVEPCELDLIPKEEFLEFLNSHAEQFRAALDELALQHSCILSAIRRLTLAPSLLANVARFLLGLNCPQRDYKADTVKLKLTQEEIAQHLGATRESVSRALSALRKNRVIEQSGRTLAILNRAMLEHLAGSRAEKTAPLPA